MNIAERCYANPFFPRWLKDSAVERIDSPQSYYFFVESYKSSADRIPRPRLIPDW